jgi:hypothetical protein
MQEAFTRAFLTHLSAIFEDRNKLAEAVSAFQAKGTLSRHNCKSAFNLRTWEEDRALNFSAAVAEALFQTSQSYVAREDGAREVLECTEHVKTHIIPQIVGKFPKGQNLEKDIPGVLESILRSLSPSSAPLVPRPTGSFFNNSLTLFAVGSAVVLGVGAVFWSQSGPK